MLDDEREQPPGWLGPADDPVAQAGARLLTHVRAGNHVSEASERAILHRLAQSIDDGTDVLVWSSTAQRRRRDLRRTRRVAVVLATAAGVALLLYRDMQPWWNAGEMHEIAVDAAQYQRDHVGVVTAEHHPQNTRRPGGTEALAIPVSPSYIERTPARSEPHVVMPELRKHRGAEKSKQGVDLSSQGANQTVRSRLAEETELLRQAQAQLATGNVSSAWASLDRYDANFQTGSLREEYSALRALTLCRLGRVRQGQAEAELFVAKHPRSAFVERIRSTCLAGG